MNEDDRNDLQRANERSAALYAKLRSELLPAPDHPHYARIVLIFNHIRPYVTPDEVGATIGHVLAGDIIALLRFLRDTYTD